MRRRTLMNGISVIVKSLLHFDTTTLTKDEVSGNTWGSNVSRNTRYAKFGNSCALKSNTSYINIRNDSFDLDITRDFTIDFWFRYSNSISTGTILGIEGTDDEYIRIRSYNKNPRLTVSGTNTNVNLSLSTNTYYYYALYYDSANSSVRLRVNDTVSEPIVIDPDKFKNVGLTIFYSSTVTGYIDEFRIREGIADPTEAIPTEAGTV